MHGSSAPVVLVTGASGGVGSATARRFAERGFRVIVHYHRSAERAERTLGALRGTGHFTLQADLTVSDEVSSLASEAIDRARRLDVLVNNAGVGERHPFRDCSFETWDGAWRRIVAANLFGPANLAFLAARQMIEQGGGRIVNVSSRGAFVGEPEQPWYGASKAGLNAMGQSLAKALAYDNVLVYTVAPGFIETPMSAAALRGEKGEQIRSQIPLGRVATADEVADSVVFLGTDAPPSMTGAIIDINGASYLRT